jgi:cholesterol oxidase
VFDAIVVGSGFGGAVAAARLSQAGQSVLVLERGRRWRADYFPRDEPLDAGWLWQPGRGLYDVRWLGRMVAVQAAGWGGGSLVYANVFARPFDEALDQRWPPHLRRGVLDPYYDLAAHMLEVRPVQADPATGELPARTVVIERMLAEMEISDAAFRPNLAVRFGDPEAWTPNVHGVAQRGCRFVGECVIGCRYGAKNSLDHNYLAVAERAGAQVSTDSEVTRLAPHGDLWQVQVATPLRPGAPPRSYTARRVFLAAGAVGTTELLLRARDIHRTLPRLSCRLGEGFSGNGDFLALSAGRDSADLSTGPTITTSTVLDVWERNRAVWFQTQDGAFPSALHDLADQMLPWRRARAAWRRVRGVHPQNRFAVLSMGRDSADGVLTLDDDGEALLRWSNARQARLVRAQERVGPAMARLLGAPVRSAITWALFRRTVTVHPLGGVPVGADEHAGVVDEIGEVHGYPGLFVMDGSTLPASTGVNPSATILAMAERGMETIVRRITGNERWEAPERADARPVPVPEDAAFRFMAERRKRTRGDGVTFGEELSRPGTVLRLRARVEGMAAFLEDPQHPVQLDGTLRHRGTERAVSGTLELFPEGSAVLMQYRLRGDGVSVIGRKTRRGRGPVSLLYATTHLRTEVDGERMILGMGPASIAGMLASIRGSGFTRPRRLRAAARFVQFFAVRALRRGSVDGV